MKDFKKFPSIDQFRRIVSGVKKHSQFIGLDEEGNAQYDYLAKAPIIKATGTVKLHGCFEKNTLITLSNGENIKISELKTGTFILSYDVVSGKFVNNKVLSVKNEQLKKQWIKLEFDNDKFIECTVDHLFYTKRGWIEAQNLTESDEFITV